MEKSNGKTLALCTLGGVLGFVIGSQMPSVLWRIALTAVGAGVFYIVYDPKQALLAVQSAWKHACRGIKSTESWDVRTMFSVFLWDQLFTTSIIIYISCFTTWIGRDPKETWFQQFAATAIVCWIVCTLYFAPCAFRARKGWKFSNVAFELERDRTAAIHALLPMVVYDLIMGMPAFGRFAKKFFWKFFLIIHSEQRLLTMFSVCVGAIGGMGLRVMYLRHHHTSVPLNTALVCGVLVGLVYGLVGNEVIRKRWLIPKGYLQRI
ncbi:MAG: hypothetical protein WC477_03220 [Patescibacteria group bacterium]